MAQVHQSAGIQEAPRVLAVVPSPPFAHPQIQRAAANLVTVPFNYSAGQKQGGP
jgi:hypothetical protein